MGQSYKASADLNPGTMLIGDQASLKLSFSFPVGTQVVWPSIKDTILGYIQVIDRSKVDTAWSADKKTLHLSQNLRLTCFDSGFYTIPPIRFYYRNLPDTTIRFEQTGIQVLTVHTIAVDTTLAIKPIKGPVKVPFSILEYLPWIIAGIIFLVIAGFLLYYYIRRRKGEPVFVLRPAVKYQPHERALMELEKLRVKKMWQSGKTKEYHTELTEIIRKYIEERFHVMALECTTGEILEELEEKTVVPAEYRKTLSDILSMADLVKFAKYVPFAEDHERSMEMAVDFINKTFAVPDMPGPGSVTVEEAMPEKGEEKVKVNEPMINKMN